MNYSLSWHGTVLIGKLSGELGFRDQTSMTRAVDEMTQTAPTGIVLDFREVVYLASMGIGMLIKLAKDFHAKGIRVRLAAPRPGVKLLLEMVCAESLIPMDATLEEAIQQVSALAV